MNFKKIFEQITCVSGVRTEMFDGSEYKANFTVYLLA